MTTPTLTKGQKVAADVSALLRARNPLLWIVTREEARVEGFIAEAAANASYVPRIWDIAAGVADLDGAQTQAQKDAQNPTDAFAIITAAAKTDKKPERGVWIMRDLPIWLQGAPGAQPLRSLRNLARLLPGVARDKAQAVIVLSPDGKVPDELAGHCTVIDWPLPDRDEIAATLDAALSALPEFEKNPKTGEPDAAKPIRAKACTPEARELAIDAAVGLSGEEAAACFARSLVQTKTIDPKLVSNEKRRVVAREGVLEWYDPIPGGLDAVGGLENVKSWLLSRTNAFSPAAKEYGLPSPKGIVVVGVSGCGKSLLSKSIATAWQIPLLRVDLGALKGKFVGDSEGQIRKVFRVIEAIGRCVVWLDEIEKSLQGATSGSADGGVSSDQLGAILTWMEERKSGAFVIATANDVSQLPPELLRKGRFDNIFFVDTPNDEERVAVLKAALKANGRAALKIDFDAVAVEACRDFTGAEIAAIVPDAMFAAFNDALEPGREPTTKDLIEAAATVVPLTKTASEKIEAMRKWGADRAVPATRKMVAVREKAVRALDIE